MFTSNVFIKIIVLFQTTVGFLANFFLLSLYILHSQPGNKSRPLHLILTQLLLANITMLVSIGGPEILQVFEISNFLDDAGCKIIFFLYRIAQGLSICFTCLLCSFQAITISPSDSTLSEFKGRFLEHISTFCFFCWILNILIEIPVPIFVRGPISPTNNTHESLIYCSMGIFIDVYFVITTLRNVLCVGLMFWTSSYMVLLLYRHHQQMKNIHSTSFASRAPPEVRATQTILLLMSTFVCFYLLHSITLITLTYLHQSRLWLTISFILSLCFPTISPFVLLPQTAPFQLQSSCILWRTKNTDSHIVLNFEYRIARVISPAHIHVGHCKKILVTRKKN